MAIVKLGQGRIGILVSPIPDIELTPNLKMSTFSKSLLLRPQCRQKIPKSCILTRAAAPSHVPRPLSTTSLLHATPKKSHLVQLAPKSKPKLPIPPSKPLPSRPIRPAHTIPAYTSLSSTLASKPRPTLLYRAPPNGIFVFSAYSGAALCFVYSAWHAYDLLVMPKVDVPDWVTYSYVAGCTAMTGVGIYLLLIPRRIVSTISAVPVALPHSRIRTLSLRVELRKLVPRPGGPKVLVAEPKEMVLSKALAAPVGKRQRLLRMQSNEVGEENSIRANGGFFQKLFYSISRLRTGDGFLKLEVKGKNYRLDASGGWALDDGNGKALDKLVKIKGD